MSREPLAEIDDKDKDVINLMLDAADDLSSNISVSSLVNAVSALRYGAKALADNSELMVFFREQTHDGMKHTREMTGNMIIGALQTLEKRHSDEKTADNDG